jgi:hypothetical protein
MSDRITEPRKLFWLDSWTIAGGVCIGIIMAQCLASLFSWTSREIRDRDKEATVAMEAESAANKIILEANRIHDANVRLRNETDRMIARAKVASLRAQGLSIPKDAANRLFTCAEDDKYFCWEPLDGSGPWGPFPTKKFALEYIAKHPDHK